MLAVDIHTVTRVAVPVEGEIGGGTVTGVTTHSVHAHLVTATFAVGTLVHVCTQENVQQDVAVARRRYVNGK